MKKKIKERYPKLWIKKLKGQIKIIKFKSEVLKNNPLKDPYVRDILVYLPERVFESLFKGLSSSFFVTFIW